MTRDLYAQQKAVTDPVTPRAWAAVSLLTVELAVLGYLTRRLLRLRRPPQRARQPVVPQPAQPFDHSRPEWLDWNPNL